MKRIGERFHVFLLLTVFLAIVALRAVAQFAHAPVNGKNLSPEGSDKPAFTIFTNPGEDCSTSMNISWATPPGKLWMIELTDESTGETYIYDYDETFAQGENDEETAPNGKKYKFPLVYRCETFNGVPSVLGDNSKTVEKHVFDKHGYELFDLEPDKDYTYRIITLNDSTGVEEYSDFYRFHTAGAPSWKAAVIGDFHHYSPLWRRLDAAMGMLDVLDSVSGGFDWVLCTGDQVAWGGSYNFWTQLSEQPFYQDFMWASVQGNHDHMTSSKKTSDNFFRDSHFFPDNGYEGQKGVSYWFRYGDVLFIMLNNETLRSTAAYEDAIRWMEDVVEKNPSKYIVVVEHYNWIIGPRDKIGPLGKFHEAFDRMGVDLALSGHNHVYQRTYPLFGMEAVDPEEGTYYVVNSSSDNARGRRYKKNPSYDHLKEKIWTEGPETVGAMLMDVNPQRIEMTLFNRHGEVEDSFTVPAKR